MIPHSRPWLNKRDIQAVHDALTSGMIARGAKVSAFEEAVGEYLGIGAGVATASGASALQLALQCLGVRSGFEVVIPSYVCRSILDAVLSVGAIPKICDVNNFGVITAESVATCISSKTAAIVAVHIFGHPCDIEKLKVFELPIVEDACQAFGLKVDGKYAGTLGSIGIFSFHATKCLTTGEGGMLVSRNNSISREARNSFGLSLGKSQTRASPMSDLQAVLGLSQMERYSEFLLRRKNISEIFQTTAVQCGLVSAAEVHSNFLFRFTLSINCPFEDIQSKFLAFGVHVRRGVDELLHRLMGLKDDQYLNSVNLFNSTCSVPFYPGLDDLEITKVCRSIEAVLK